MIRFALPRTLPLRLDGRWLALALRVMRERRRLGALEPERLADLGIDPDAAAREAARPPWDLPSGR